MLNSRSLDELAARISQAFENSPAKDIEKNIKTLLTNGLTRLDVVPRAEFDVQAQVLLRTREKVEALERRVGELEARFGGGGRGPGPFAGPGMGGPNAGGMGGGGPMGGPMGEPGGMGGSGGIGPMGGPGGMGGPGSPGPMQGGGPNPMGGPGPQGGPGGSFGGPG